MINYVDKETKFNLAFVRYPRVGGRWAAAVAVSPHVTESQFTDRLTRYTRETIIFIIFTGHMGYTLFNSNTFKVCVIAHKPHAAANVMWP